jgi:hypothetical protein
MEMSEVAAAVFNAFAPRKTSHRYSSHRPKDRLSTAWISKRVAR